MYYYDYYRNTLPVFKSLPFDVTRARLNICIYNNCLQNREDRGVRRLYGFRIPCLLVICHRIASIIIIQNPTLFVPGFPCINSLKRQQIQRKSYNLSLFQSCILWAKRIIFIIILFTVTVHQKLY